MKKSNDLISIHKVYDSIEAELIKSHLATEGIESFLKADNAGGTLSYFTAITGIEIIIHKADAQRAHEVIERYQSL